MNDTQIQELKTICASGVKITHTELAAKFGCGRTHIQKTLYSLGINKIKATGRLPKDITNCRFGSLVAIEFAGRRQSNHGAMWLCKCDCGKFVTTDLSTLQRGEITSCRKCLWVGDISEDFWNGIKRNAKRRGIEFNLTKDYAWNLFLLQNRMCAFTGETLIFSPRHKGERLTTASIDRLENNKGYIEGNIQWVHKNVNFMRRSLSVDEFINLCEKVYKYKRNL